MDAAKLITATTTRRMRVRDTRYQHGHVASGAIMRRLQRRLLHEAKTLQERVASTPPKRNGGLLGALTREVHDAIRGRLGHRPRQIPGDSLQALFNDMKLYVSDAQVDKMIQCARQGKQVKRNGAANFLTFGEVCIFASTIREMQKPKFKNQVLQKQAQLAQQNVLPKQQQQQKENKYSDNCEVFLGGSCNPTTWRTDTAIPELQRHGITYYNPQVSVWAPELIAQEHHAKQSASLLLYVVDSQTRSVAGMIEVAYLVASGRCVVLVANPYIPGQTIMDEVVTQSEYFDLMHGQTSLLALVKSQGIKVHGNLAPALQCTANILRNGSMCRMTADEQVTFKLSKLREVFDMYDCDNCGEIHLKSVVEAYHRLTNRTISIRTLCSYLSIRSRDATASQISFDQFCVLVAECSGDDIETFASADGNVLSTCKRLLASFQTRLINTFIDCIDWFRTQIPSNNNNQSEISNLKTTPAKSRDVPEVDVFLGGPIATDWRAQFEQVFKEHNVSVFHPAESSREIGESSTLQAKKMMDNCRVLLFYITSDTRSLTSMILAAHYIGLGRPVVLCVEQLSEDSVEIDGEILTKQAIKDYNRGRVYLQDLAKRKLVPVFENITESIQAALELSKSCG